MPLCRTTAPKPFVSEHDSRAPSLVTEEKSFDVVVCGGTLGVFIAAALAVRQPLLRIAIVERAPSLRGRAQEWNLSLKELRDLVDLGVLHEV